MRLKFIFLIFIVLSIFSACKKDNSFNFNKAFFLEKSEFTPLNKPFPYKFNQSYKVISGIFIKPLNITINNQNSTYFNINIWTFIAILLISFTLASLFFNWLLKKKILEKTKKIQLALLNSEKTSKIKTNFIQNISHEIRTPMNGILGYSELLKKEQISVPELNLYVNTIIESGKDLVHIIDNMLELSALQTDESTIHNELINLAEVIENIVSTFKTKAGKKKIELIFNNNEPEKNILIDKLRLIKILKNIIDNAIKFTHSGVVSVSYKLINSRLEISIADTGIGIKKKDRELIFDSFAKLEKQTEQKLGGIGLGLTVAKKNALILGGEITFTSEVKKGSTFNTTLPVLISKTNILFNSTPTASVKKRHIYKILIAEDEQINFLLVNSILSRFEPYNFSITRAENGKEAIDFCKENNNIDLVIMDIRMPIMDGYQATSIIKKLRPNLPIIAHTAYSSDKDIQNAIEAGCDTVICKPINLKEFKQTILTFLK